LGVVFIGEVEEIFGNAEFPAFGFGAAARLHSGHRDAML
jgi:hypothetical protein